MSVQATNDQDELRKMLAAYLSIDRRQALRSYANREAITVFSEALEIAEEHPALLEAV